MDPRTLKFLIFCGFSVLMLAGGYAARRRGWAGAAASRRLHFVTIVFVWSTVGLLSLWKLPPDGTNAWLLLLEPLLVAVPAFVMIPLAKAIGCSRGQTGVLAIAAALGNTGFTMGAYLCYTLLADPAYLGPGSDAPPTAEAAATTALAYAIAQVTIMANVGTLLLYPLARHYGELRGEDESVWALIGRSLFDVRAVLLYAAIAGVVLAYTGVPYPEAVDRWGVIDVLFYVGAFTGYAGIGLQLHLGRVLEGVSRHALLAGMKFVGIPLLTLGLLLLANLTAAPPAGLLQRVMLIEAFMPTAIQGVIIANLFHLDTRFATGLWIVNTVFFLLLPLPIILLVMA